MSRFIDISGQKFNFLTVTGRFTRVNRRTLWDCVCDCGNKTTVDATKIKSGHTKSCGCYLKIFCKKHGHALDGKDRTSEYNAWGAMIQRCCNPSNRRYKRYGGRGITICDRWKDSYENFYSDMGAKPSPDMSLDRINNNGNYEPSNCRWATITQQNRNLSRNRHIEHNGVTMVLAEWSRKLNVSQGVINTWMKKGKDMEWIINYIQTRKINK